MDEVAKRRLLVKGFPEWIRAEDKESLLRHFGAKDVVVMPTKGRMRNTAFAEFTSTEDAQLAMQKLHQLELFGCRLVAEFSKTRHTPVIQEAGVDKWRCNTLKHGSHTPQEESQKPEDPPPQGVRGVPSGTKELPGGLLQSSEHPFCHVTSLCYDYPPVNPTILHNIANALACIPKFYTQVLHLMNKLNLPPPFGLPVPAAPMLYEPVVYAPLGDPRVQEEEEEEEKVESELDSDGKEGHITEKPKRTVKRRRPVILKRMQNAVPSSKKRKIAESFEMTTIKPKKIEIHAPTELKPATASQPNVVVEIVTSTSTDENVYVQPASLSVISERTPLESVNTLPSSDPSVCAPDNKGSHDVGTNDDGTVTQEDHNLPPPSSSLSPSSKFISQEELDAGRLPQSEMKRVSVFKGYTPGEPSMRLYVKNLAKNVTEKDLEYIFGRYVDWSDDVQVQAFDVRVMQSGRLRGQAFVGLPTEHLACQARLEVNGYELHGKPLVVCFARTTKARAVDGPVAN